jgi:hypothetical protein
MVVILDALYIHVSLRAAFVFGNETVWNIGNKKAYPNQF